MAKIKPIYLIGAAAVAAYFFRDKLFGAKTPDGEIDQTEAAGADAVVDTTKTGQTVSQAIETAKQIAQGYKDVKVLIKTPAGQKDISYTKGDKKPKSKKRRSKRRHKKAKLSFGLLESSFKPFAPLPDGTTTTSYASYAPGYNPKLIK
jgi:hypothetical protein